MIHNSLFPAVFLNIYGVISLFIHFGTFIHFVTGKFLLLYCFPKILPESFLPHCCFHLLKAAGPRPLYHHPDQPPAVPAH